MTPTGFIGMTLIALLITNIFTSVFKNKGPWNSSWSFFLMLLFAMASLSLWIPSIGPTWLSVPWLDFTITALLIGFFLSTLTPLAKRLPADSSADEPIDQDYEDYLELKKIKRAKKRRTALDTVGSFFWMVILFLGTLIIVGFGFKS